MLGYRGEGRRQSTLSEELDSLEEGSGYLYIV
jgi:hypothetical protein